MAEADLNALATAFLDAAFRVHTVLGPVLLESAYEACLCSELQRSQVEFQLQVPMPLVYQGEKLSDVGYRLDVLIRGELIVEAKPLMPSHPFTTLNC